MNDEQTSPDSGDDDSTPQLSPDEAKAVIRAISDVEREEAESDEKAPDTDDS